MQDKSAHRDAVLAVIAAIPRGEVRSYSQVALLAGWPGRARQVARLLALSDDPRLPWHRVVRADGRLAFAEGSRMFDLQVKRLTAEGVAVRGVRVTMDTTHGTLDAELWGPQTTAR